VIVEMVANRSGRHSARNPSICAVVAAIKRNLPRSSASPSSSRPESLRHSMPSRASVVATSPSGAAAISDSSLA
jgi:hypothetical protein